MSEKRTMTFYVTVEIDPEAYAEEYGTDQDAEADAAESADSAFTMLRDRMMHAVTVRGVTLPSFTECNGHWATVTVSDPLVVPLWTPPEPKTYDHEARPDDLPEPGDRCKDCGEDITYMGPEWIHVNDEEVQ